MLLEQSERELHDLENEISKIRMMRNPPFEEGVFASLILQDTSLGIALSV